jgi:protocatechuate 3,4-dioxygenase, beta subunit
MTYRKPYRDTQPPYLFPPYASTVKRAPSQPLVVLPQTLSELTAPVFGSDEVKPSDSDLTRQHKGEPQGERIVVSGRVLDENSRPLAGVLIEIWQANAAGRYNHRVDQHDAPLDPNFTGAGRAITDRDATPMENRR